MKYILLIIIASILISNIECKTKLKKLKTLTTTKSDLHSDTHDDVTYSIRQEDGKLKYYLETTKPYFVEVMWADVDTNGETFDKKTGTKTTPGSGGKINIFHTIEQDDGEVLIGEHTDGTNGGYGYGGFSVCMGGRREHDESYTDLYNFPVHIDTTPVYISQGNNGATSHNDALNRYAIDWNVPQGTKVYSMRGGLVLESKGTTGNHVTGLSQSNAGKENRVIIMHHDGTLGRYLHLEHGGAHATVGEFIGENEFIGTSGNTGMSTGAHLHSVVTECKVVGGHLKPESIAIKYFKKGIVHNHNKPDASLVVGTPFIPQQGKTYKRDASGEINVVP